MQGKFNFVDVKQEYIYMERKDKLMYRCLAREVSSREKGFFGGYCFRKWGLEYFGVRFLKKVRVISNILKVST